MMTLRFVLAGALILCVAALGIASTLNSFAIVEAVNAKLPADKRFNSFGWYLTKTLRLHKEYRRLYPDGRLLTRAGILMALMWLCLVMVMGLLGFDLALLAFLAGGGALLIWFIHFRKRAAT